MSASKSSSSKTSETFDLFLLLFYYGLNIAVMIHIGDFLAVGTSGLIAATFLLAFDLVDLTTFQTFTEPFTNTFPTSRVFADVPQNILAHKT